MDIERSMMRRTNSRSFRRPQRWLLCAMLAACAVPVTAEARRRGPRRVGKMLHGRVIQITARSAYVNLGRRHGVRPGDPVKVRLPDRSWDTLKVDALAARSARLTVPESHQLPAVGAPARARWRPTPPARATAVRRRPPPAPVVTPVEQLARAWQGVSRAPPRRMAYRRSPVKHQRVPRRRIRGYIRLDYAGTLNLGEVEPRHYSQVSLSSSLEVPRVFASWLDYAHRLRLRLHLAEDLSARPFQQSRPLLLVDRMRLGLTLGPVRALIGRALGAPLPAATVIDGTSVRVRATPWLYLGAFGGLLPRSTDMRPSVDGAHFGAYAALRWAADGGRSNDWQVAADLGFAGTTWDGQLDRRALGARASFDTARLSLAADAVVDLYGGEHPSGMTDPELTQLGVSLEGQLARWLRIGGRYDRYRFVPSREQLATYPLDYLAGSPVSSTRGYADLTLGASLTLSGQGGYDRQDEQSWSAWGEMMVRTRALIGEEDLRLSAMYNRGTTLGGLGGRLAVVQPIARWLSLSGSYALFHDRYTELDETVWRHALAAGGELSLGWRWFFAAEARTLLSREEELLQLFGTLRYDL